MFVCYLFLDILEDCTDCFGGQKKDEPSDKDKKDEEETPTSAHHSIIETWDWGRQPGMSAIFFFILGGGRSGTYLTQAAIPKLFCLHAEHLVVLHLSASKWGN